MERAFPPAYSSVNGSAPILENAETLASALATRLAPIQLDMRGGARSPIELGPETETAIEALDAALLVPLRPGSEASAFICLGGKRSRDVYTTTDRSRLASVSHAASEARTEIGATRFG
jgi:hypothetical protein